MSKTKINVYWFRKGLRLHDNQALLEASQSTLPLLPVFIFDPLFLPASRTPETSETATGAHGGQNQFQFLRECLQDVDRSLKDLSSRLVVFERQTPEQVFHQLFKHFTIDTLYFEKDSEPYAQTRDQLVSTFMKEHGTRVRSVWGHTLFDLDRLRMKPKFMNLPRVYRSFLNGIAGCRVPPVAATVTSMPVLPSIDHLENIHASVPTIADLGHGPITNHSPFYGGEAKALQRMERNLKRKKWMAEFEKPKTNPAALKPDTTVLSPYICHGALSVRLFYHKVQEIYDEMGKHSSPPQSMHGQLFFREWFYYLSYVVRNFDKMEGNELCLPVKWDYDQKFLDAFREGRTGFPWIDAIMRQLKQEGWVHHLARHSVACFLTRGQLWQSWEEGKKIFSEYLLDGDYALNSANWMWLSCSAFFTSYFRVYGTESFPKKYDKQGAYVRKYCPELAAFPNKFIYCPSKAPLAVQKNANCIIGKDYPKPIVDEKEAKAENIAKMKAAYAEKKKGKPRARVSQGRKRQVKGQSRAPKKQKRQELKC